MVKFYRLNRLLNKIRVFSLALPKTNHSLLLFDLLKNRRNLCFRYRIKRFWIVAFEIKRFLINIRSSNNLFFTKGDGADFFVCANHQ